MAVARLLSRKGIPKKFHSDIFVSYLRSLEWILDSQTFGLGIDKGSRKLPDQYQVFNSKDDFLLGLELFVRNLARKESFTKYFESYPELKLRDDLYVGDSEEEWGLSRLKALLAVLERRAQKPKTVGGITVVPLAAAWDLEIQGHIYSTVEELVSFSMYSELAKLIGAQSALILFGTNATKNLLPKLVTLAIDKQLIAKEILEDLIPNLTNVLQKNVPLESREEDILGPTFDWSVVKEKLEWVQKRQDSNSAFYLTYLLRQIELTVDWALLLN